jgi:hypothetical protein
VATTKKSLPSAKIKAMNLLAGGSGNITIVTKITKGFTRGTISVEMQTLTFSGGEFQGSSWAAPQQLDLLC